MKSIIIKEHGDINVVNLLSQDEPDCPPDRIKVNIKACSINHLDIWVRNGIPGLDIPLPLIMGSDASGRIVEVGKNIDSCNYSIGQDVIIQPGTFDISCKYSKCGMENYSPTYGILGETEDGVQSEYVLLKLENIYPKPRHLSFEEAASMPLVFMTSYQMLVERAKLKKSDTILIYGGTSGIGIAAIQIARSIGARIITTVGNDKKKNFVEKLNPDYVLNHHDDDLYKKIKGISSNGVDIVFEHIGSSTWEQSLKVLSIGGKIITCGATTGNKVSIDLRHLFMKQQTIMGSTMSSLSTFKSVMKNIKNKEYQPYIDRVYKFEDVREAHMRMENRKHFGKIIIIP